MSTHSNLGRLSLPLLALFVFSVLAAPVATAQQSSLTIGTITGPTTPIQPDIGTGTIKVPWTYTMANAAINVAGVSQSSVTLTWQPPTCDNSNVLITGALSYVIPVNDGTPQTAATRTGESAFNVAVNQNAPGETQIRCTFTGKVSALQAQAVPETSAQSGTVNVVAAYLGLITVNVPGTIKQSGPQKQIRYDLEVSNLGNSRSNVVFSLLGEGAAAGGWNPVIPTPIVLESSAQGGQLTSQTVSFLVSTPFKNGWNNKDTTFNMEIKPVSTKDPEKEGQAVNVNVLARVRGVYVPTLEPFIMLAAVLGSALLMRRSREE